jgi:predicted HD phosphohydrolase
MTKQLSPAAQAVASAYDDTPEKETSNHRYLWLAAALRAAADGCDPDWLALTVLHHLHSIADELEAQ